MTFDKIMAHEKERWLEELRQDLCAGKYTQRRLQRWVMRRSGQDGTGYRQHPDEYLYETLGLYPSPMRLAEREGLMMQVKAGCGQSARPV